jgi:L,D-transpeptidase ErfK/SrfK
MAKTAPVLALLLLTVVARPAWSETFALTPGQSVVGAVGAYVTKPKDTLIQLARAKHLGYTELATANRAVDPWAPGVGTKIVIPDIYILPDAPRLGIIVNLAQRRLYYFPADGKTVETYPIGVGVIGRNTPIALTKVTRKEPHPAWYPPQSIRAEDPTLPGRVAPGPDNPLGDYALRLGLPAYLIHGTNKPYGVGRNVSHGCIRLYPEDIKKLFQRVKVGTPVRIIDQPDAVAWVGDQLYVAVYPDKEQTDAIDLRQEFTPSIPQDLVNRLVQIAGDKSDRIDWDKVEAAAWQRSGMPVDVTKKPVLAQND